MSRSLTILFISFLLLSVISCKKDKNRSPEDDMNAEDIYFLDYEAPVFKWGYIDTLGQMKIEDEYDAARPFNNNLAIVNKGGKWGFINKENNVVIPFKYRSAFPFQSSRARFQNFEQRYGYINFKGEEILEAQFEEADDFSEGLAKVKINGFYRYIDTIGQFPFEEQFTKASKYQGGFAKVQQFEKYGIIDPKGNIVCPIKYDQIYWPKEGITRAKEDGKFGYLKGEKSITEFDYDLGTDFHEGIAAVFANNSWTFINTKGKIVEELDYDHVEYGNEGFWMVSLDGKFGMVNSKNEVVIPIEQDLIYKYHENRCAFSKGGFWGFFDDKGEQIKPAIYGLVWDYVESQARVLTRDGIHILRKNGEIGFVSPSIEMRDFSEGLACIQIFN